MTTIDPVWGTVAELSRAFQARTLSPVDVVDALLARIERRVRHHIVGKLDDLQVEPLLGGEGFRDLQNLGVGSGGRADPDCLSLGLCDRGPKARRKRHKGPSG